MLKTSCISEVDLSSLSNLELLSLHSKILTQLRARGVIRTKNNPVGDYAEWLVSKALGMTLLNNSSVGADAIDSEGMKVQIKSRRETPEHPSRQLSALRNYEAGDFDYLVAVIFDEDYQVQEAYKIPHGVIRDYARHQAHVNAHIIILKGAILSDTRVTSIKEALQNALLPSGDGSACVHNIASLEVMPDALEQPKSPLDHGPLPALLKAIGMECFVNWYLLFANNTISSADLIERLHIEEGYTEKSCRGRLSKARKIINTDRGVEALKMIASSGRVNDSVREKAHKLITTLR